MQGHDRRILCQPVMAEAAMTSTDRYADASFEIFIEELMMDEELLRSFLREPQRTLRLAADWGLPLSDSQLQSLERPSFRLLDKVLDALESRFAIAA
jgi:hypothetical protein